MPELFATRISVIVPAFNAESTLCRSVESLLASGYPDLEIIVVDDASTDSTLQVARRLERENTTKSIVVLQHYQKRNRGVSASRNLGMARATGELICFLDADDTVAPHRFQNSVRILTERPDVDAVYETASVVIDDASQVEDWSSTDLFGPTLPLYGFDLLKSLIRGLPWHTSAVLFRKSLLAKTGGFHEAISIAEDCHLWMRMVVAGNVVPGDLLRPVSQYRRHSGSLYTPAMERKLDYLIAVASFLQWVNAKPIAAHWENFVRAEIAEWLDNALIQCRQNNRHGLALRLGLSAMRHLPEIAFTRRSLRHLFHAVLLR
jgi:glycosyltransferase involved in cell wall biosynthesis